MKRSPVIKTSMIFVIKTAMLYVVLSDPDFPDYWVIDLTSEATI